MVTERTHNGDTYLRVEWGTETNEILRHEALKWYPSILWYREELFVEGLFFAIVSSEDTGEVFKMYSFSC